MSKIMNDAEHFVDDSLKGLVSAFSDQIRFCGQDDRGIVRTDAQDLDKTAIVTGGGYGHLPTFMGFVGDGFVDGCAVGNVFTSPSSETVYHVAKEVDCGKGVLFLIGNYFGDTMNFEMAQDMLEMEGIQTKLVKVTDDILSAPPERSDSRRRIAGIYFAYKMAGAKAAAGGSLEEAAAVAEKVNSRTMTVGFAFSPCQLPGKTAPIFEIGEDEMEIGMGIHGEPGVFRTKVKSSREIAEEINTRLLQDRPIEKGTELAVLINGLGATSREELGILYGDLKECFERQELKVWKVILGEYATSMEMKGASVSICLLDDELKDLLEKPGKTPFVHA